MLARRSLLSLLGLAPVAAMTDSIPPQPSTGSIGGVGEALFGPTTTVQWVSKEQQAANWNRLLTGRDSRHDAYMLAKAQYQEGRSWAFPDIENKRSWSPAFKALQTERRAVQMIIDRERFGGPYNRFQDWLSRQVRGAA